MATISFGFFTAARLCRFGPPRDELEPDFSSSSTWHFTVAESVEIDRHMAKDFWSRLCDVPTADSMRCHVPVFGIRFLSGSTKLAEASICWKCNNIYARSTSGLFSMTFDGQSPSAQQLLVEMKQHFDTTGSQSTI